MSLPPVSSLSRQALRARAESELLTAGPPSPPPTLTSDATADLLRELRLQGIELRLQEEELRRVHSELDAALARRQNPLEGVHVEGPASTPLPDVEGPSPHAEELTRDGAADRGWERPLLASEQRFRDALRFIPAAIGLQAESGMLIECSDALCELSGYSREELTSRHPLELNLWEQPEQRRVMMESLQRDGRVDGLQATLRRRDGRRTPLQLSSRVVMIGGQRLLLTAAHDISALRQADTELLETRNRLQSTLDAIPDLLFEIGPEGRILRFHAHRSVLLAAPPEVFLGKTLTEVLPPVAADTAMSALREASRDGYSVGAVYSLPLAHGETWFELSISAMPKTGDGSGGFIALIRDITVRKRAEESLRRNTERYELVALATNDAIWDWDQTTDLVTWNEAYRTLFGHPLTESTKSADSWSRFIHPDDIGRVLAGLRDVLSSDGTTWSDGYRFRRADGRYADVWDRGYVVRQQDGKAVRMIGAMQDITSRKAAEAGLAESQALLRSIIDSTPGHIFARDLGGRFTLANEAMARDVGLSPDELVGKTAAELFPPPAAAKMAETDQHVIDAGEAVAFETGVSLLTDGRPRAMSALKFPLRDANGNVNGIAGVAIDITERRMAELALIASLKEHDALRAALNEHVILTVANSDGRITDANDRFCQISQYTREELIGREHSIVNSERHSEAFFQELWATITSGNVWRGEINDRAKDGTYFWVYTTIVPLLDEHGSPTRYLALRTDITDLKASIDALEEERVRFELAASSTRMGLWDWNPQTDAVRWDERCGELFGRRAADLGPDLPAWSEHLHPEERTPVLHALQSAVLSDAPFHTEHRIRHSDGSWRWVLNQGRVLTRDVGGGAQRFIGTLLDVTELRQAQADMAVIHERLKLATLVGGVGIWEYDVVSNALSWDDQMFALYGVTREQFTGVYEAWASGVHREDRERGAREITAALSGETEFNTEFRVVWPDSTIHHIRAIAVVLRDGTGRAVRMIGTNWDVTEAKLNEERLEASNRALSVARQAAEDASKAKSAFLANMSHEIRTPLTAILGFTELLLEDGAAAAERRNQTIETIKHAGRHLLTVINDILDLSKIEADKMIVERIATPLVRIVSEVEDLMRPPAVGNGLTLRTVLATPVPSDIVSDPTRLRQILLNLVGNAVKFTEQGDILITVGTPMQDGRPTLVVDVQDSGPGLTAEAAERLFRPFVQSDDTLTRKHQGSGLGLTICRRLANLMGGDVTILWTEPGRGSCFRLSLPLTVLPGSLMLTRLDSGSIAQARAVDPAATLTGRILLAEDSLNNQRLISFHLKKAGAEVEVADNGLIALAMLDDAAASGVPYGLLVTDIQMPEMDGYTLASTLRARGSRLPIIALTAHAMAEDRQRCLDAGCDDYVTKPISKANLLAACGSWLGKLGGATH